MSELKALADQLRNKINQPVPVPQKKAKTNHAPAAPEIVDALRAYDLADHDSMIHVRFENPTAALLHHLKRATGIEVNKVVGYAVKQFLRQHPELKTLVKNYLQKIEL
jgi:hypothetical protein